MGIMKRNIMTCLSVLKRQENVQKIHLTVHVIFACEIRKVAQDTF
jgi:hypothetical protein